MSERRSAESEACEFHQFWVEWDVERASEWLRERFLSFRQHHAELQTCARPEEFADLFVEWCADRTSACSDCDEMPCECVRVGSIWRRNPPGREVVRVERAWTMGGEHLLRAHPAQGGRPLVIDRDLFREMYTEEPHPAEQAPSTRPDGEGL